MIAKLIRERILSVPHTLRELTPAEREDIRVEETLLGWVLHIGRHKLPCDTEGAARYLGAFAKLDYTEVIIPQRAGDIAVVVDEVEKEVENLLAYVDTQTEMERYTGRQRELLHLVLENIKDRIEKALQGSVSPRLKGKRARKGTEVAAR